MTTRAELAELWQRPTLPWPLRPMINFHADDRDRLRAHIEAQEALLEQAEEALVRIRDRAQRVLSGAVKSKVFSVADYDIQVAEPILEAIRKHREER